MSLSSHHHAGHAHAEHDHGQLALIDALTGEHASAAANRLVRRSVNVSMGVNIALSVAQITVGWLAHSHSLLVDGFHSFSDLLSDLLVLFVARHSVRAADENHPYGHARLETLATLVLGLMLVVVGGSFLYSAGEGAAPGRSAARRYDGALCGDWRPGCQGVALSLHAARRQEGQFGHAHRQRLALAF